MYMNGYICIFYMYLYMYVLKNNFFFDVIRFEDDIYM